MNRIIMLLFLIFSLMCQSQNSFNQGYFIDNSGNRVECLIKDVDWKNNPTKFLYKLDNSSKTQTATIIAVEEFAVNEAKFIRAIVDIDRSYSHMSNATENSKPTFTNEKLFLKVIEEGAANLYYYEEGNLKRFFYSEGDGTIEQLVFKSYFVDSRTLKNNNQFRQQLLSKLNCDNISKSDVESLKYRVEDLRNFFIDYNECKTGTSLSYSKKRDKKLFRFKLKSGLTSSQLLFKSISDPEYNVVFDNEIGYRIGLEFESIIPFNNDKWSLFVEANYQKYFSQQSIPNPSTFLSEFLNVEANYSRIEIPLGLRHYLYLSDDTSLFLNFNYILIFAFDSSIDFGTSRSFELSKGTSTAFGLGCSIKKKYSVEIQYDIPREITPGFDDYQSKHNLISLVLGIKLF